MACKIVGNILCSEKEPVNASWLAPLCPHTTAEATLLLLIKIRLLFVQVTQFRLTLVGHFSNLAPPLQKLLYTPLHRLPVGCQHLGFYRLS